MCIRDSFSTIPILIAIICGYIAGVLTGVIETQTIIDALHTSFISCLLYTSKANGTCGEQVPKDTI